MLARPLWFDEIFTFWASRLSLSDLIGALRFDSGPPGFYLLERPFAALADRLTDADALVRIPSLIATLLALLAAPTLPRGRARAAFVALLSGSALFNLYAGEARPYAVLALTSLALFLLALRGVETAPRFFGIAGLAALSLYTHYLAAFVVAALLLLAAAARRWRSVAALATGAVAFLPWLPTLLAQPPAALAWMRETPGGSLAGFASALGGVGRVPAPFGAREPVILFAAGIACGAALLALLLLRSRSDPDTENAVLLVLLVLGGTAVAGVWRPVAFAGRTEMAVLPVWMWAVARAAAEGRATRWTAGVAVALGLAAAGIAVFSPHPPAPGVEVAETLSRVARPGDVVVAAASFYLPARLAADRHRLAAAVRSLPEDLEPHPGWFLPAAPNGDDEGRLGAILQSLAPGARLFLAIPPAYATPGLLRTLSAPGGRTRELLRRPDALVLLRTRDGVAR